MSRRIELSGVGQRILLTLWVGGLWTAGYIVAPLLFHVLDDNRLAGQIAGEMFTVISYIGLVCGALLLLSVIYPAGQHWRRTWQIGVLVLMLVLIGLSEFILQPMIHTLKAATPQGFVEGSAEAARFGMLHGVSSILFLITSLSGLALVVFGLRRDDIA